MSYTSYNAIADEYYDERHVTSRNFDSTTKVALSEEKLSISNGLTLELGAGRGRATEYLGIDKSKIVQLDSSSAMFEIPNREECSLKILSNACKIPLVSHQFSLVVGFLVDPFIGLECLSEAYRMLKANGQLLFSVPTKICGDALRSKRNIQAMSTRFKMIETEEIVEAPSILQSPERIIEMLNLSGFQNISITGHCLPKKVKNISPDIEAAAYELNIPINELEIINIIKAER